LKNSLNIEQGVQKPINNKFDFNDITNALFFDKQPLFIIQPFKDLKNLVIKNTTFSLSISLSDKPLTTYEFLKKAFPDEMFLHFLKLPSWMLGRIIEKHKEGTDLWASYVMEHLKEYCKNFESKWRWNTLKTAGINNIFKTELTVEKRLWMYFCDILDKEEQVDFVIKVRDSLLPWFNFELWQQMEKKKENTRENVAYEEIKEKILFNSSIKDDDLDIIG